MKCGPLFVVLCFFSLSVSALASEWEETEWGVNRKASARKKWRRNSEGDKRDAFKERMRGEWPHPSVSPRKERRERKSSRSCRKHLKHYARQEETHCPKVRKIYPNPAKPHVCLVPEGIKIYENSTTVRYTLGNQRVLEAGEFPEVNSFANVKMCICFSQYASESVRCRKKKVRIYIPDDGISPLFALFQMVKSTFLLRHAQGYPLEREPAVSEEIVNVLKRFYLKFSAQAEERERRKTDRPGMRSLKRAQTHFLEGGVITYDVLVHMSVALNLSTIAPEETLFEYGGSTIRWRPLNFGCNEDPWGRALSCLSNLYAVDLKKEKVFPYQDVTLKILSEGQHAKRVLGNLWNKVSRDHQVREGSPSLQKLAGRKLLEAVVKGEISWRQAKGVFTQLEDIFGVKLGFIQILPGGEAQSQQRLPVPAS